MNKITSTYNQYRSDIEREEQALEREAGSAPTPTPVENVHATPAPATPVPAMQEPVAYID